MWHQIRLPGPHLDSALEADGLLRSMVERLTNELMVVQQQILAFRAASYRARLLQTPIEVYTRHEQDGSEIVYLNDGALQLYRDVGGMRPVEGTMNERPPQTAEQEEDILRGEALLLRHTRLSLQI